MNSLSDFLARYGLIALVPLAAVESDLSMILAGALSHRGLLWLPAGIVAGTLGSIIGDTAWFLFGRRLRSSVQASAVYQKVGPRIEALANRLGLWQLFVARFIWGTRSASMFFWGQHGLSFPRFLLVDAAAALIGAVTFGVSGYVVGQGAFALLGHIKRLEHWLVVILLLGIVVTFSISRLTRSSVHDSNGREP
ncbi:MAG TPA: DedA family protein [Gemmatimonadales bacterium]|nr:DedA family protein [Gemmatimonadales bacterium]